ncbi:hypothetical protein SLS55_006767 [Diplodia seriata]|uniref:Uncharacterized protein n=1 Tax=Diplodia seriata TaxID=420778 RepID=A0ABR3CF45_9PEZI
MQRVSIEFPFLSIPGANPNTLFRLAPIQAITATNPVALAGSAAYGTRVLSAVFDPPCDAYASLEGAPLTIFDARKPARAAIAGDTLFTSAFATVGGGTEGGDVGPYPLTFFQRVVQQPLFADPSKGCDRQLRRFDTVVTKKPFLPVLVKGVVWASAEIFQGDVGGEADEEGYKGRRWHGAWGVRVDTAFVEWNKVDCDSL